MSPINVARGGDHRSETDVLIFEGAAAVLKVAARGEIDKKMREIWASTQVRAIAPRWARFTSWGALLACGDSSVIVVSEMGLDGSPG